MADLNSHFQFPHYRRRFGPSIATYQPGGVASDGVTGTGVHFAAEGPSGTSESVYTEKGLEYDHVLRQSRMSAAMRRRGGPGSSMMGMSTLLSVGPSSHGGTGVAASVYGPGELAAAPSVVLGDSQGSTQLSVPAAASGSKGKGNDNAGSAILSDTGDGDGLGGSYVDGAKRLNGRGEEEEEEDLDADGGVLGLLAQIYGRRDGPAAVL